MTTASATSAPTMPAATGDGSSNQASGKIAVVKTEKRDNDQIFTCVVDGVTVGTSKHKDYFEFHQRRGDIVRLNNLNIGKFVYLDPTEKIVDTVKIEGAPAARGSVQKAITLARDPKPAPVGFNNQTHAQAQENGRKGAMARLSRSGQTETDRPKADGAVTASDKPKASAKAATPRTRATRTSNTNADRAAASVTASAQNDQARERAREFGRMGAQKAAEMRAAAAAPTDKPKGKPGRPRKVRAEGAPV